MSDQPKRKVQQAYKKLGAGPTPDNPYHNVDSGTAAIINSPREWKPPYALGKGPPQPIGETWTTALPRIANTPEDMFRVADTIELAESSGGKKLYSKTSSARAPLQYLPALARERGLDPNDFAAQKRDGPKRMAELAETLKANGFAPTYANIYALHWRGPKGGLALLNAPDEAPITRLLTEGGIAGNHLSSDMTAKDLRGWVTKKGVVDDVPAGVRLPSVQPIQATPISRYAPFSPNATAPTHNEYGVPYAPPRAPIRFPADDQGWPNSTLERRYPQLFTRKRGG